MFLCLLYFQFSLLKCDSFIFVERHASDYFLVWVVPGDKTILLDQVRVCQIFTIADRQLLVFCDGAQALHSHEALLAQLVMEGNHDAVRLVTVINHV